MNFPLVWHNLPSGSISREPSPVLLYRLPRLSQHPPALQSLSGAGSGAARVAAGCVACSCARGRCRAAAPPALLGGPIWIGWTATGDSPPAPEIGTWAEAPATASAMARKTSGRFISGAPLNARSVLRSPNWPASSIVRRLDASEVHRNISRLLSMPDSSSSSARTRQGHTPKPPTIESVQTTALATRSTRTKPIHRTCAAPGFPVRPLHAGLRRTP